MARLPEQRLWDRLRKAMTGKVYTERIENLVGVGRPDVDTLIAGSFIPIELKQVKQWPARATSKVLGKKGLSQVQKNWHLQWKSWGGKSLIVVGVGLNVYAFTGDFADDLNDFCKQEFDEYAVAIGLVGIVNYLIERSKNEN